jgi:DNA polymerase-1
VAFDLPQPTFRHLKYDGYKAKRKKMPEELAVQIPLLKELLTLMGIKILSLPGYEADDVIGTMAKRSDVMTYVLTGARDSLQLIDDTTHVVLTKRGITETLILDEDGLKKEFGLTPSQVVDYKALAGDTSDNIPGVPGIGEKTALNMLESYSTLDGVYSHLDEFSEKTREKMLAGKDLAYLSYFLATIDANVPIECKAEDCEYVFPFTDKVKQYFIRNNFKSLIRRDELFTQGETAETPDVQAVENVDVYSTADISANISGAKEIALYVGEDVLFATDKNRQYTLKVKRDLIGDGVAFGEAMSAVGKICADENVKKIVFDGKKLMYQGVKYGFSLINFDDVKLMQFLLDNTVDVEDATAYFEGLGKKSFIAAAMKEKSDEFRIALKNEDMERLYYDVELPLEKVLFDMERYGVAVNSALMDEIGEKFSAQMSELTAKIYAEAGKEFNINSPKQLATVLFEDMGIPYPKKTKKYSTSAEILEELEDDYPIIKDILQYRFVAKLNGTYIEGLKKLIDNSGRIHTEYKQMLTSTGRLSSVEPNLQNIPTREAEGKILREMFVAGKGRLLISADYSQIELRLLAHFSQDSKMVEIFNKGEDLHAMTASEVFGVKLEDVTPAMRRNAKTVNFGIIYGISEYGLAKNLHCKPYEAREHINTYFRQFSSIKEYFDKVVSDAKKNGYTTTLLNRKRKIPELNSPNFAVKQFGERAAMNAPLQGSAADIIKIAMLNVAKGLEKTNSRLILQIHDELIIDADEKEKDEVIRILKDGMEKAWDLRVPLVVEAGYGKTWFDCK